MTDQGGKVVPLDGRRVGARPRLTVSRELFCTHYFELDRKARLASCSKCQALVDPWAALVYIAEHWPDFHGNREAIRHDLVALGKQRDELRAEVRRLKQQVRRATYATTTQNPQIAPRRPPTAAGATGRTSSTGSGAETTLASTGRSTTSPGSARSGAFSARSVRPLTKTTEGSMPCNVARNATASSDEAVTPTVTESVTP